MELAVKLKASSAGEAPGAALDMGIDGVYSLGNRGCYQVAETERLQGVFLRDVLWGLSVFRSWCPASFSLQPALVWSKWAVCLVPGRRDPAGAGRGYRFGYSSKLVLCLWCITDFRVSLFVILTGVVRCLLLPWLAVPWLCFLDASVLSWSSFGLCLFEAKGKKKRVG